MKANISQVSTFVGSKKIQHQRICLWQQNSTRT